MFAYHLARFRVDATPPMGHPLCGGWIKPVEAVDDRLWLRGVVLLENGPPIVLAALDWTGVLNESDRIWTEALADAARTTPDRVALHSVHQHNAPFVDLEANRAVRAAGASPLVFDEAFFGELVERSVKAVRQAVNDAVPVRHVAAGVGNVEQVASNRRVLGPNGKVQFVRYSATKDPEARAAPEGTIDPTLRSVAFYSAGRAPLARLYYYTTHPMSYYGDGRVTSDFVGLARDRRDRDSPETLHVYFTGCAGNITAGKYNDGAHENRAVLSERVYNGMIASDRVADERRVPFEELRWVTSPIAFEKREDLDLDRLAAVVSNAKSDPSTRNHAAMSWAWLKRLESGRPIVLSRMDLPGAMLLHLPAETFVEYQLEAQKLCADRVLCTAAYGDGGPWYIPLRRSFDEGGYEPSAAHVSRETEPKYRAAIAGLIA